MNEREGEKKEKPGLKCANMWELNFPVFQGRITMFKGEGKYMVDKRYQSLRPEINNPLIR